MTMEMAIYVSMAIVMFGVSVMVAFAVWLKKQETPEFSFLRHIRNMRMNAVQYEKFASSARMMMYLYAFLAGIEANKGDVSMAVTFGALFLGLQATLFGMRTKWVWSFFKTRGDSFQ